MLRPRFAVILLLTLSTGCSSGYFNGGKLFSRMGKTSLALRAFEKFVERSPEDPRSGEALVRAGEIYEKVFSKCREARRHYEASLRRFPSNEPWSTRARAGLMGCPDYFPLDAGHAWIYGDSDTGGNNMRLEWRVLRSSGAALGEIETVLFAGDKKISSKNETFEKEGWSVWQLAGSRRIPFLRYPFNTGMSWSVPSPQGVIEYLIESDSEEVETDAGLFKDCLKIRERNRNYSDTWKYDYYAPNVGRIKTSIGGPGYENPNTELIKFDKIAAK